MHHARNRWILAYICAVAPLAGCDDTGDDDGTATQSSTPMTGTDPTADDSTGDLPTSGTTGGPGMVDYETDIQPIWSKTTGMGGCVTGCHTPGGSAQTAGPFLDPGTSYAAIVGVQSPTVVSLKLVEPGDSNKSYLWHKLNNTFQQVGGSGTPMPQIGMLTPDELELIKAWIDGGALP
jgi:hypothetical protein